MENASKGIQKPMIGPVVIEITSGDDSTAVHDAMHCPNPACVQCHGQRGHYT